MSSFSSNFRILMSKLDYLQLFVQTCKHPWDCCLLLPLAPGCSLCRTQIHTEIEDDQLYACGYGPRLADTASGTLASLVAVALSPIA